MFVWLRGQGFESSVNEVFQKEKLVNSKTIRIYSPQKEFSSAGANWFNEQRVILERKESVFRKDAHRTKVVAVASLLTNWKGMKRDRVTNNSEKQESRLK